MYAHRENRVTTRPPAILPTSGTAPATAFRIRHAGAVAVAAMALLTEFPHMATAQDTADGAIELPSMTVTARKRKEVEQAVPIGMTVLEGDRLDAPSTAANAGLARAAPNVTFTDLGGQSANLFNIRGVGSFSPIAADDTSVLMYVGEVPQSVYFLPPTLLDVERVEMLRGPQGTLFGRNTQGGAISILPRAPTFDREGWATAEIGTRGYRLGELVANDSLIPDRLAGRLALRYTTSGGDIPNAVAGGEDGDRALTAGRGSLLFTPNDRTTATLTLSYNRQTDGTPRFLLRDAADFPASAVDPSGLVASTQRAAAFKFSHDFGPIVLDSLTSIQRTTSRQRLDLSDSLLYAKLTGLPAAIFNAPGADLQTNEFAETSYMQEVRLSAPEGSAAAWTAGMNFFRSELSLHSDGRSRLPSFALVNGSQDNESTTNSASAFGEVTVPVADRLRATLGLRASHEDKDVAYVFHGNGTPGVAAFSSQKAGLSDSFLTGRGALSYDWSDALTTYASVARGYVTGGFPSVSVNSPFAKPEPDFPASTSWSWEAGFKARLLNGRLALNGAVFLNDVKNGHLVVFNPAAAIFTTAALDYRSWGGEIEATARLLPGFDLFGGIGYTHAEIGDVPPGSLTGARSGNDVPNVPAVSANLGAQYRLPGEAVGLGGSLLGRATYQHVGARAVDVANSFDLKAYDVVNLKVAWEGEVVDIYGFANNLLDERYEAFGQSFGAAAQSVRVGQGRIVGIGTTVRF